LGSALAGAVSGLLGEKLAAAKAQINKLIQEKVGGKRAELTKNATQASSAVTGQIQAKQKQADGLRDMAQGKLEEAKKKASAPVQNSVNNARKKLKF
jgi:hypothetical protein